MYSLFSGFPYLCVLVFLMVQQLSKNGARGTIHNLLSRLANQQRQHQPNFTSMAEEELAARNFISMLDLEASVFIKSVAEARWAHDTNISEENQAKLVHAERTSSAGLWQVMKLLRASFSPSGAYPNWQRYEDHFLSRLIWKSSRQGAIHDRHGSRTSPTVQSLTKKMSQILSDTCNQTKSDPLLILNPDSTSAGSRLESWAAFRIAVGKPMRPLFTRYIQQVQKEADAAGLEEPSYEFLGEYEMPPREFRNLVNKLWEEVQPLYRKLHSFVRYKLADVFPGMVDKREPIPAHLAGDMFASKFAVPVDGARPFRNISSIDVAAALRENSYTVPSMYRLAERFFTSMGFDSLLSPAFWNKSMLEEPKDGRLAACNVGSAWDFNFEPLGSDHRVKMCTKISHQHLVAVHHLVTQVAYDSSNMHLPRVFRTPPFPGFVEAIGGALTLSLDTPQHLVSVDLVRKSAFEDLNSELHPSSGSDVNYLMRKALGIIVGMPFAFATANWRWDILDGKIPVQRFNAHWWKLREEIQGIAAPVFRSDSTDLDPGGIPEIAGHQPIISHFVSAILQFQLYESMCKAAGQYNPDLKERSKLHRCNLYNSKAAGNIIRNIMRAGSSENWKTTLNKFTEHSNLSSKSLKKYFAPLETYLDRYLQYSSQCVGWGDACKPHGALTKNLTEIFLSSLPKTSMPKDKQQDNLETSTDFHHDEAQVQPAETKMLRGAKITKNTFSTTASPKPVKIVSKKLLSTVQTPQPTSTATPKKSSDNSTTTKFISTATFPSTSKTFSNKSVRLGNATKSMKTTPKNITMNKIQTTSPTAAKTSLKLTTMPIPSAQNNLENSFTLDINPILKSTKLSMYFGKNSSKTPAMKMHLNTSNIENTLLLKTAEPNLSNVLSPQRVQEDFHTEDFVKNTAEQKNVKIIKLKPGKNLHKLSKQARKKLKKVKRVKLRKQMKLQSLLASRNYQPEGDFQAVPSMVEGSAGNLNEQLDGSSKIFPSTADVESIENPNVNSAKASFTQSSDGRKFANSNVMVPATADFNSKLHNTEDFNQPQAPDIYGKTSKHLGPQKTAENSVPETMKVEMGSEAPAESSPKLLETVDDHSLNLEAQISSSSASSDNFVDPSKHLLVSQYNAKLIKGKSRKPKFKSIRKLEKMQLKKVGDSPNQQEQQDTHEPENFTNEDNFVESKRMNFTSLEQIN